MKPNAEPKGREEQKQSSQSAFKLAAGSHLGGAPQLVAEAAEARTLREDGGGATFFFPFFFGAAPLLLLLFSSSTSV